MIWRIVGIVFLFSCSPLCSQVVLWDSLYWKKQLVKINDAQRLDSTLLFLGTGNGSYGDVFEMDMKGNIIWDEIVTDSSDIFWTGKYCHSFSMLNRHGDTLTLWGFSGKELASFNLFRYDIGYRGKFLDSSCSSLSGAELLGATEDLHILPNGNILMSGTDGVKVPPHIVWDFYNAEYTPRCERVWKKNYFYKDSFQVTRIRMEYSLEAITEVGIWWRVPKYDSAETHITNFDLQGNIISQHQIPYRFAPFYYCNSVEPDGNIVMVGVHHNNLKSPDDRSYVMIRIDTAGNIITAPVDIGKYGIGSFGWVRYMLRTPDGGFMICGVYQNDDFDSVMYVVRVDRDFRLLWQFERFCERGGGFSHIQPVDSNTYLCTGLRYQQRMYAVMLRDEKAVQVSVKEQSESGNDVEVYPNPTSDELYIRYGSVPSFVPLFVSVATMRGEAIELPAQRVAVDFFSVDVRSLEQGTYTALVNVGSTYKTVRFIVLR